MSNNIKISNLKPQEIEIQNTSNITIVDSKEEQEKTLTITKNGITHILPDNEDKTLSKVTISTEVPVGVFPTETLEIVENGEYDVTTYESASVNTPVPKEEEEEAITITTNGITTIRPTMGKVLSRVNVTTNVPTLQINNQNKTITQNGTYNADSGYTGLGKVVVNVPTSKLGTKTITENGTYNASSDNLDGYNEVVVNVPTSGSGGGKYAPTYFTFYYCNTATNLDYETQNVDTSNVTSMEKMFYSADKLKTISPIFDVSNVTTFKCMFQSCMALTSANLSSFGYSPATTCEWMFYYCQKLTHIDLSNFETPNLTNTKWMFYSCKELQYIDIRKMNFDKVTTYTDMFNSVPSNCEIIVADDKAKAFVLKVRSALTNVKTVAEL